MRSQIEREEKRVLLKSLRMTSSQGFCLLENVKNQVFQPENIGLKPIKSSKFSVSSKWTPH